MIRSRPAFVCLTLTLALVCACLGTRPADAQEAKAVEPLPQWDWMFVSGWRGVRIEGEDFYNDWDAQFAYAGGVGYYWTPHLKAEAEIGGIAPSRYGTFVRAEIPGQSFPFYARTEHRTVGLPIAARVLYQFGENVWFHPFVGAGIAFDRTRDEVHTPRQTTGLARRPDGTFEEIVIVEESRHTETYHDTRGVVMIGFKAYATERGFMRTDVQWSVGSTDRRYISWRVGLGMDF